MKLKKNDPLRYVPTDGPHKGKLCPAIITEVIVGELVNLEVWTADGHFVEHVSNVILVSGRPKPGQACLPK